MPEALLDLSAAFGGFSSGDQVARIGVTFDRDAVGLDAVDAFVSKRCACELICHTNGDHPDQQPLPGMDRPEERVSGHADIKGASWSDKKVGFGLTFNLGEIDSAKLLKFAKRPGRLRILEAGPLPEATRSRKAPDDHPDLGTFEYQGGSSVAPGEDAGARIPLSELCRLGLTESKVERLKDSLEIATIGDLERKMREDAYWHKKVHGFGETWINKTIDALLQVRKRYPHPEPGADPELPTAFDQ